jgi:hypothetical protein
MFSCTTTQAALSLSCLQSVEKFEARERERDNTLTTAPRLLLPPSFGETKAGNSTLGTQEPYFY